MRKRMNEYMWCCYIAFSRILQFDYQTLELEESFALSAQSKFLFFLIIIIIIITQKHQRKTDPSARSVVFPSSTSQSSSSSWWCYNTTITTVQLDCAVRWNFNRLKLVRLLVSLSVSGPSQAPMCFNLLTRCSCYFDSPGMQRQEFMECPEIVN